MTVVVTIQTFLTIAIGAFVAFVAYQQYKISQRQLKASLRPARLQVYEGVKQFLALIMQKGNMEDEDYLQFLRATKEADFIFLQDKAIKTFLDTIAEKACKLRYIVECINNPNSHPKKTQDELYEEKHEVWGWLCEQNKSCDEIFQKYLGFK
jgi:hypothetical protein